MVNAEAVVRKKAKLHAAAIIIDAGTATTIDALVLGSNPAFLRGAILPGMQILRDALAAKTAQLPLVELKAPDSVIGPNTDQAIRSGVVLGYASMVDGMIQKIRTELGQAHTPCIVATGGLTHLLETVCEEVLAPDYDLTLKGIGYLYESFCHR